MGNRRESYHGDDENGQEREPSSLPLHELYTLFRLHFTPERNVHHSRADFFDLKREDGESAADVWKPILVENCGVKTLTAEEEKRIRYLNKRKTRPTKEIPDKPTKVKKMDCNKGGATNWSQQHECPERGKCAKSGQIGHFAKCCRWNRKVYLVKGETSSAAEDNRSPDTIH